MSRRRDQEPLERIHLWVFKSDAEWLATHFSSTAGVSKTVRQLIRTFRRKVEAKAQDIQDQEPSIELNLEESI